MIRQLGYRGAGWLHFKALGWRAGLQVENKVARGHVLGAIDSFWAGR
jgi:hypothetical protein